MKKIVTLMTSVACGIVISNAQITITNGDVVGVGKVLYQATDTTKSLVAGGLDPGPSGANQTWNFSNLLSDQVDTLLFTNPAWTADAASFPNSNLAIIYSDSTVAYLINNSTGLFIDGAYGDLGGAGVMSADLNPNEQLTSFPNTYNSSFQNASAITIEAPFSGFPGVDSARVKQGTNKTILTDGWGSITTPLGTFNCLRQKGKVVTTDSIWLHSIFPSQWNFFDASTDSSWRFSWYGNGTGFPLLEFDSTEADTIRNISWLKIIPIPGSVHESAAFNGLSVYPNPSSNGKFILSLPGTVSQGTAEVYTALGEKIFTSEVVGGKEGAIDISAKPNGIYLLQIKSKEGASTRKIVMNR